MARPSVIIVIPARYASTRLPGKPLADICGKPMIQHVYERAMQVGNADTVLVAVDDQRVADVVQAFGGHAIMTRQEHESGTDRLAEVMQHHPADLYINIQGDEPLIRPEDISKLIQGMLADPTVSVGTLCHALPAPEATDPNQVKVVLADNGNALYFSRSPIPYQRAQEVATYLKHVGVYAYRSNVLQQFAHLPQPMIECAEKLEQLRLLAAGFTIRAFHVKPTAPGVDTFEGLERIRQIMADQTSDTLLDDISTKVVTQDTSAQTCEHSTANLTSMARTCSPSPTISALAKIKLVITDVDGVLTDGSIFYNETGECLKRFHVRDGLGICMLEQCGIKVAILSGRDSATLRKRVNDLGASFGEFGVKDKFKVCNDLMQKAGVSAQETIYLGDDTIDLPAFAACGLSYSVADAEPYIKQQTTGILAHAGGQGAFRELADMILEAHGLANVFTTQEGFLKTMNKVSQ